MSSKKEETPNTENEPTGPPRSAFREYFESFVGTLIVAIFGMTFIVQGVTVPTGSMQNTILIGDYLLVNKFVFTPGGQSLPFLPQREIKRGDIIVFKYPGNRLHPENDRRRDPPVIPYQINYVKRVIGLPGETVEFKNNQVFVGGEPLPEHRILGDPPTPADQISALITKEVEEPKGEPYSVYYGARWINLAQSGRSVVRPDMEFGVEGKRMLVPDNQFFVMGDSRDNSEDSRYWGFVPRELIIGRAMFVYWSCDRGASNESALGCITNPRLGRIGAMIK